MLKIVKDNVASLREKSELVTLPLSKEDENLLKEMQEKLSIKAKKSVFFELIFMTYSYVHNAINHEAFPNAIELYNKEQMTGRGRGKYAYKPAIKEEAKKYMQDLMKKYFPSNEIKYIV